MGANLTHNQKENRFQHKNCEKSEIYDTEPASVTS